MISEDEKRAQVKMFCAYCRRTLANARTDILREEARRARREALFSDMGERELNRLAAPGGPTGEEVVFEVLGREVGVEDARLGSAMRGLGDGERAVVLLYYFAGWTDRRIAETLGCSRSTVQFDRLRASLEGGGGADGL